MAKKGPKARTALTSRSPKPRGATGTTTKPPAHLKGRARDEYARLAKILADVGAIDRTDARLIELYAINYDLARKAAEDIEREGTTVRTKRGAILAHPMIAVLNAATIRIKSIVVDLGLSPTTYKHTGAGGDDDVEGEWGGLLSVTG